MAPRRGKGIATQTSRTKAPIAKPPKITAHDLATVASINAIFARLTRLDLTMGSILARLATTTMETGTVTTMETGTVTTTETGILRIVEAATGIVTTTTAALCNFAKR